jgi:hypothetical protein
MTTTRAHKRSSGTSADLGLPVGKQFTLIGTPEGEEIEDPSSEANVLRLRTRPLICRGRTGTDT